MNVEEVVTNMLKENTGINLLDSGDTYGRHWQKNQSVQFSDQPAVVVDQSQLGDRIEFTVNTYHYLISNLEVDSLCDEFNTRFNVMDDWEGKGYGLSSEASDWIEERLQVDLDCKDWFNTYNGESCLSQVVQGVYLGSYVLIQVHNGCDVRGGYTDAKLFKLKDVYLDESVSGYVKYSDNKEVWVTSGYTGYSLTDDSGEEVFYAPGAKIELWLTASN